MQRFYSYLNTAVKIVGQYKGEEPLASFLKKYFSLDKKYGSRDRKQIAHLCYCYFRLGKSLAEVPAEERVLTGLFLCSKGSNEVLEKLRPEWNMQKYLPIRHKLYTINYPLLIDHVFSWKDELSDEIDYVQFSESFFVQPDLFLRLRPGHERKVKEKLVSSKISFNEVDASCLALPQNSKIENIIDTDREAVVQDYSSQRTGEAFKAAIDFLPGNIRAWDCCAASGGKSLLLHDLNPKTDLTVSDIRRSVLTNLKTRFARAGIKNYHSFVADLAQDNFKGQQKDFHLIVCDAPCTGSGTWSRTPEQLYFFDKEKVRHYSSLQKKIVSNVIPHIMEGGFLIYITCSVFKKENEEVVDFIKNSLRLELISMEYLKGYDKRADTLFVSLFKKA